MTTSFEDRLETAETGIRVLRNGRADLVARLETLLAPLEELLAGLKEERQATNQLLVEILAEQKRANSVERTGAVSSASVKTAASKRDNGLFVDIETKAYAGSEVPVVEALASYSTMVIEATALQARQWQATYDELVRK